MCEAIKYLTRNSWFVAVNAPHTMTRMWHCSIVFWQRKPQQTHTALGTHSAALKLLYIHSGESCGPHLYSVTLRSLWHLYPMHPLVVSKILVMPTSIFGYCDVHEYWCACTSKAVDAVRDTLCSIGDPLTNTFLRLSELCSNPKRANLSGAFD